jgi:hypothetical protein
VPFEICGDEMDCHGVSDFFIAAGAEEDLADEFREFSLFDEHPATFPYSAHLVGSGSVASFIRV